ncbi:MAG: Gfo/Idh/MocA family oxidoreductase [Oscillospiraceae bacterium]|nr:Gfo/Idh/MocA family oxidoreductase [Oscillospiraceae bacterium]
MKKANVAIVGCGNISSIYLENLTRRYHNVEVTAVCDMVEEKARAQAEKYGISRVLTFEEILADPDIDIVLNITTPQTHYSLCKQILLAGKHTYVEKPLSLTYEQGRELVALAKEKGLCIGCAPDTFLGAGIQTCRRIIDEGIIGEVIGASAFMMCHGHESWHPDPEFYYKRGGGPMFDMGPYYLTALVNLIGSAESVYAMTSIPAPQRTITSQPKYGQTIDVEVPTHVSGMIRFSNGAIGNIITSFDVWGSSLPRIEIYGKRGCIIVPDPNCFDGEVKVLQHFDGQFRSWPLQTPDSVNSRGIGLADMADAILSGRTEHRACGELALHVLEIMEKFHVSSDQGRELKLESDCCQPEKMPLITP